MGLKQNKSCLSLKCCSKLTNKQIPITEANFMSGQYVNILK